MVRINWWKENWKDGYLGSSVRLRTAWFFNRSPNASSGWIEFKPSEELYAALCVLSCEYSEQKFAAYDLEEDLFESLGYEVVERNDDDDD